MSVIVDYECPSETWVFGELSWGDDPIRIDSAVDGEEEVSIYLWLATRDAMTVERRLDEAVRAVETVDSTGGRVMVRVERSREADGPIASLVGYDAALLEGVGRDGELLFRVRFSARETVDTFQQECHRQGVPVEVRRVRTPAEQRRGPDYGLSPAQRSALVAATEMGYFRVPREATLSDLGERLDVSDTAVSQRLRRGVRRLVSTTIGDDATRRP